MKKNLFFKTLTAGILLSTPVLAQNPGGVPVAAWYRSDMPTTLFSDAGVTNTNDGSTVQQWNEYLGTGYNLIQTSASRKPVFSSTTTLANFNPTVTFDGSNDWMQYSPLAGINIIDRLNGTLYAAGYVQTAKRNGFMGFHSSMDYPGLHLFSSNYSLLFFTGGPGYQGQSTDPMSGQAFFTAGSGWENGAGSSASYAAATVSLNGVRTDYSGTQLYNVNQSTGARMLRVGADDNYGAFSGQLNEMLVFENKLTTAQMDQVESYLAIKYGTTYAAGTRDYKNAAGNTVWDATAHANNHYHIAGIARDDNGALHQKQSWSTDQGTQVLISTTGLANTNADNASGLSNGQYLIWGDNGLEKRPTVALSSVAGLSHRFAAVWQVQNTGSVGTVRVAWPAGFTSLSLIQNSDSTFSTGNIATNMTGNTIVINGQNYNYADVTLSNGQYFTFGAKLAAPGGVSGPVVWLKANEGINLSGSSVSGWMNFGNSGGVAGQLAYTATTNWALPKYGTNIHNFNPAVIDDVANSNDGSLLLEDVFPASGQRNLYSFVLHSHSNVAAQNNMISYTPLKQTYGALEAPYMASYGASRLWFYWQGPYQNAPTLPNGLTRYNNIPSINGFYVPEWVSGTPHQTTVSMNGATALTPAYNINATSYPFGNQLFIFGDGANNNGSGGQISEVISYDKVLTTTEKQQVNSYLAIKYGITLYTDDGTSVANYLSSNANIVWDAAANSNYNKNIAGIAHDQESMLEQKQSQSVNVGQQLLIGTTGLDNTNAANATTLSDGQYLIWGDNGLARVPAIALTGVSGVNYRFPAVWKAQNTGSVGPVRVAWPAGLTNLTLIQGTDSTFATVGSTSGMAANTTVINGTTYNYTDVSIANGQYFTFATQLNGPGGVGLDLRVWLRSDAGFTPADWADLSGNANNYTQTNASRQPFLASKQYNYNPIVDFGTTGADARFMVVPSGKPFTANGTDGTIFTATTSNTASGYTDVLGFGATTTGTGLTNANAPTFTKLGNNLVLYPYTTAPTLPAVTLGNLYLDDVSFTVGTAGIQYAQNGQLDTVAQTVASGQALFANGSILGAQPEVRNGFIGEVIAYERNLSEAEKVRVRSYVAIKYGITLPHDYIASNGSTIFWSISGNDGYNHNIAGIARDDYGSLQQKQSHSINAGNQVLIGTTGLSDQNATNSNLLSDQQFLAWGDNGQSKGPAVSLSGVAAVNQRFAAVWKVQNTGAVGTVRVAWKQGYAHLKLVQSTDTTFDASDVYTDMDQTQTIDGITYSYADVSLTDGTYFTFAAYVQAPGGVSNGLSHWYRADKFVESAGNGTEVGTWTDFTSGVSSAQLGSSPVPMYQQGDASYFNYNPGLKFTATNQKLGNITEQTLTSQNFDIFSLTKEGMSGGRFFNIGRDNTTFSGSNWDAPGLNADGGIARRNNSGGLQYNAVPSGNPNYAATVSSIMYNTFTNTSISRGVNGSAMGTTITHGAIGDVTGGHMFGANSGDATSGDDGGFTGHIGELIIYGHGSITAAERTKVESYLAVKYGITLANTNDYVSSQDSIIWDATANSSYYNNVAGVGYDYVSALLQKQSRSQHANTNGQVTMGLGQIDTTNEANPASLQDGQFLLWGDNGNTQAMTNTASTYTTFDYEGGTDNGHHMNRVWKVQNTGISDSMLIRFPIASVGTTTLATGDACGDYAILVASDSAFTMNLMAIPVDTNSGNYEAMYAFPEGMSYFTFAKLTPLSNGTVYLPLVVENTNEYTDNCGVGEWSQYYKTGTPQQKLLGMSGYTTTELDNFDINITPEGIGYDDGSRVTNMMARITTVADNNGTPLSTGKIRIYYSPAEMSATTLTGAQTNGWFKYEGDADSVMADIYNDGIFMAGKAIAITPDASGTEDGVAYVEFHNITDFDAYSSFVYISSTETQQAVLPVQLQYFNAIKIREQVQLDWATAHEQNNKGFTVEHSTDARQWTSIGFVASQSEGNSHMPQSYTHLHQDPADGANFYRLKQEDYDGQYIYSDVRTVVMDPKTPQINIVPNPAHSELNIQGLSGVNHIRITNTTGQVMLQIKTTNVTERTISIGHFAPGLYLISITHENGTVSSHKVIKD